MLIEDLGVMNYRRAWDLQQQVHERVLQGEEERILLVEHPPVVTLGRRPGVERNLVASPEWLNSQGVELVQSDRGGDITFHGPGQLVAYPIIRLIDHRLSIGGYVHRLESAVISALREWGIEGQTDKSAVGVWVEPAIPSFGPEPQTPNSETGPLAKICAIGVRIRRGVTMHGLALNVTTNLDYFKLIVPCGLASRPVTSLQATLREKTPPMERVKQVVADHLRRALGEENR